MYLLCIFYRQRLRGCRHETAAHKYMHRSHERARIFGVSCRYSSPLLQMQKGVFHLMPCFIKFPVMLSLFRAITLRGNDWLHSLAFGQGYQRIGIISSVGQ